MFILCEEITAIAIALRSCPQKYVQLDDVEDFTISTRLRVKMRILRPILSIYILITSILCYQSVFV